MNAPARPLRRNIVHSVLGNVAFAVAQFAIVVALARMGTAEELGAMTLATALVTPFFLLAQMGLREGHSVDDLDYFTRADYAALRWVTAAVAFAVVALLAVTFQASAGWLVQATTLALALIRTLDSQANMSRSVYQRAERMDYVALSMLAQGVGGTAGFVLVYWLTGNLPLAVLAQAVALWTAVLVLDRRCLTRLGARTGLTDVLRADPRRVWRLLVWMLPLGFSIFMARSAVSAPPMVLGHYADLAVVGIFGAMIYVEVAMTLVSNAISMASAPRLRRIFRAGDLGAFRRLALRLVTVSAALGLAVVLGAWLFGDQVLGAIFGDEYRERGLFALVMIGSALRITSAPLQAALAAGQAFRQRLGNTSIGFAAALVTAVLAVPAYGAEGAAAALIAGALADLVLTARSCLVLARGLRGDRTR